MKLFEHFLNKNINSNDLPVDEEKLLRKYGKCEKLNKHINLLVITDTHGLLGISKEYKEKLINLDENDYDLCCCLGDITYNDYDLILQYVPEEKIVAILGNHDDFEILKYFNLFDLNGKVIEKNGIKLGAIQGSWKYKDEKFPSYTHEESIKILDNMEKVDILLSHTGPYWNYNKNPIHKGLKGINKYLYKNKVSLNIHGHNHVSEDLYLKNGTHVKECYMIELLKI